MPYWPFVIFLAPLLFSPLEIWARKYRGASALLLVRRAAVFMIFAVVALLVAGVVREWTVAEQQQTLAFKSFLWFPLCILVQFLLLFALLRPRRHKLPTPRQFEQPPSLLLSLFLCSLIGVLIAGSAAERVAGSVASHLGWDRPDYISDISSLLPRDLSLHTLITIAALLVCAAVSGAMVVRAHRELLRGEAYQSPLLRLVLVMFACEFATSVLLNFLDNAEPEPRASLIFWAAIALHHYLLVFTMHWEEPYFLGATDLEPPAQVATQAESSGMLLR